MYRASINAWRRESEMFTLQRVFYELQCASSKPIEIQKLTSSLFDWNVPDSFMFHNVKKFLEIVCIMQTIPMFDKVLN